MAGTHHTAAGDRIAPETDSFLRRLASYISLAAALILIVVKLWAWFSTGSMALLTSALDAVVDAGASFVTFLGVAYAGKPADSDHRWGHGKGEALAAFIQSVFLGGAGAGLAVQSAIRLIKPEPLTNLDIGLWTILLSTIVAIGLVSMQSWVVSRTGSTAIAADRAHYITDVAVNVAVLAALGITHVTGWIRVDPAFAILISGYMMWNARGVAMTALNQLLDHELDGHDRAKIKSAVLSCPDVRGIHDLRTRDAGDRVFAEFHLEIDGRISVEAGHAIADAAEAAVQSLFPAGADITAHVEPAGIRDDRLDDLVASHDKVA